MEKTVAIVVTYNRCLLLRECLSALKNQTVNDFDIIIVDNASTDRTKDMVEAATTSDNRIQYYNTGKNLGGAGGFNFGMKKAYEQGYQFFWLMDDDTVPRKTALENLLTAAAELDNEFGYLCSYAKWIDGSPCKMNFPGFLSKNIDLNNIDTIPSRPVKIQRATFVSFFTGREIVQRVGYPISDFFIWGDDTNYCLRINEYGQGYFVPNSVVVHKMGKNANASICNDPSDRLERYVYAFRNRFFNSKYRGNTLRYMLSIGKQTLMITFTSPDRKKERLRYMYKGVLEGLTFNPITEYPDED